MSDSGEEMPISPLDLDEGLSENDKQALRIIAEIGESDAANSSTPENSEIEDSDDEPDDLGILIIAAEGPQQIIKLAVHLARNYEEVIPRSVGNDTYIQPSSTRC